MSVNLRWNHSGSRELPIVGSAKWLEMRQGLRFTITGYGLMAAAGGLGALLLSGFAEQLGSRLGIGAEETVLFSHALTGLFLATGYLFMVIGQFRCLLASPQSNGAKELLFASLLCAITMVFALLSGHLLGGAENYALVARGAAGLADLSFVEVGTVLQLLGLLLALAGILLFIGFLRGLCEYLRLSTAVTAAFFWFMAFLVGGTVGVFLNVKRISNPDVWQALALAWIVSFFWHMGLVYGALRGLNRRLKGYTHQEPQAEAPKRPSGMIALRNGSFFRR